MNSELRQQRILQAVLAVEADLLEPPPLEALADSAGMSPFHFHRSFRAFVGDPVAAYAQRRRLELAACWLIYTERPAIEIAVAVGYDSREGFVRAFSRQMGATPEEFRIAAATFRKQVLRRVEPLSPLPVSIVERPACRIGFLRSMSSTTLSLLSCWWRFLKAVRSIDGFQPTQFFGINYDDDFVTPRHQQRYDVACHLPEGLLPPAPLATRVLPGGLYAVADFEGTVSELVQSWEWLAYVWMPESNWQMRSWCWFDAYSPEVVPPSWLSLLKFAAAPLRARLCIPVQQFPSGHLPTLS